VSFVSPGSSLIRKRVQPDASFSCGIVKNLVLVGFGNIEIVSYFPYFFHCPARSTNLHLLKFNPDRLGHNRPLESKPSIPLP
jgi:hypothetical protein